MSCQAAIPGIGASMTTIAVHFVGITRRIGVRDHDPDVVRNYGSLVISEHRNHCANVASLRFLVVASGRMRRAADPPQVLPGRTSGRWNRLVGSLRIETRSVARFRRSTLL
jgi:hypothetical protein